MGSDLQDYFNVSGRWAWLVLVAIVAIVAWAFNRRGKKPTPIAERKPPPSEPPRRIEPTALKHPVGNTPQNIGVLTSSDHMALAPPNPNQAHQMPLGDNRAAAMKWAEEAHSILIGLQAEDVIDPKLLNAVELLASAVLALADQE